jgi:hypothetical protein
MLGAFFQQRHGAQGLRVICSKQCARFGQAKFFGIALRKQPNCGESTQKAVKHCGVSADLAGNRGSHPMRVGAKMGKNVERCSSIQNLAAPAPEDEIDDMVEGSRHGMSPGCVSRLGLALT